ncbi:D-alanyl-D-alanine carboxypeptidase family protein [Pseudochelatococcus sp. B33]
MTRGMFKTLRRMAFVAALSLAPLATPASAGPALLVDAANGRVLYEEQASDPWYPASVTKLMTTYVVLKQIRAGRLSLDTPFKVSANAAKTQPSKMGFKPGTVLTIDNILKMMLVKSANDLAVVLAEGVGGSVEGFAAAMNAEARRLGMNDSNFVNPHGLMDPRQRTTARDMAILARALLADFPQFQPYFGIGGVQLGKQIHRNTNGLIGRYPGAEGMKTGFICASGFNVVATARRGNKRLIVVLLGEPNAARRTIRAAELFDRGFAGRLSASRRVEDIPTGSRSAPPNLRQTVCGPNRNNLVDDDNLATAAASASADGSSVHSFFAGEAQWRPTTVVEGEKPGTLIRRADIPPIPVFTGPARGAPQQAARETPREAGNVAAVPAVAPSPAVTPAAPPVPEAAQAFVAPEPADVPLDGAAPIALQGAIGHGTPSKTQPARRNVHNTPLPPPRP